MLVRGKHVLKEETKTCGGVSKNYPESHMEFGNGGPAILQELCYISFLPGQKKSSGLQLVEWDADTCMLQQISLLRWQCVTSNT